MTLLKQVMINLYTDKLNHGKNILAICNYYKSTRTKNNNVNFHFDNSYAQLL